MTPPVHTLVFSTGDESGACDDQVVLLGFRSEDDRRAFEETLRRAVNLDHEGVTADCMDSQTFWKLAADRRTTLLARGGC